MTAALLAGLAAAALASDPCSMRFDSLSASSGAPGDAIVMRGDWGPPAPYKLPVINKGNGNALEVLSWDRTELRVRLPPGLRPGAHRIGVYCNWDRVTRSSGFKDFEVLPAAEGAVRSPEAAEAAAPALPAGLTPAERAKALAGTAQTLWTAQRLEAGERAAAEAVEAYRLVDDRAGRAHAYLLHYYFASSLGRKEQAFEDLASAAALYREELAERPRRDTEHDFGNVLVWQVEMKIDRGDAEDALALASELKALRAKAGEPGALAVAESRIGDALIALGRRPEAAERFAAAAILYGKAGNALGVERYRTAARLAAEPAPAVEAPDVEAPSAPPPDRGPKTLYAGLARLRFAITVFSADRARPPETLRELVSAGLIQELPRLVLPDHRGHNLEAAYPGKSEALPAGLKDTGGWGYDKETGSVFADCTHRKDRHAYWSW